MHATLSLSEADSTARVWQYSLGFTLVFILASVCWILLPYTESALSALVFLMAIVLVGVRWSRGPVLMMATLSALLWNFVFIPPQYTLHIASPQDVITFCFFFVVALSMGHLTTRLREREASLEKYHSERELLLEEQHRRELLEESERLHRTLLDSVSHELKTPIAVIRTALDGLGIENPFAAEIQTANRRLQRIVENFLEMSRVEAGALQPRPDWCEVQDVVEEAKKPLELELRSHSIQVIGVDDLPLVYLDSRLLAQALSNVLHNASLHAPRGSEITLQVTVHEAQLTLAVRDRGAGLPSHVLERVFEKFYRAPSAGAGGTGLGLPIARGLLRAMKGDMEVENHPHGGAVFTLTLPVKTKQP